MAWSTDTSFLSVCDFRCVHLFLRRAWWPHHWFFMTDSIHIMRAYRWSDRVYIRLFYFPLHASSGVHLNWVLLFKLHFYLFTYVSSNSASISIQSPCFQVCSERVGSDKLKEINHTKHSIIKINDVLLDRWNRISLNSVISYSVVTWRVTIQNPVMTGFSQLD